MVNPPSNYKNPYSEQNHASALELKSFMQQLTADQLCTAMPAGWNVMAVLAHVAFWDIRALTLIEKWQKESIQVSQIDTDVINEVTRPIFLALDPAKTVEMVNAITRSLDEKVDSLSPEFINKIETEGKNVHMDRAKHRRMHIDEIREFCTKAKGPR